MVLGDIVVTEKRLPCDYMQIQRMQVAHVLRQVGDGIVLDFPRQRMLKRNVDGAVTVLNVKHHGVSARITPAAHQFNASGAASRGIELVRRWRDAGGNAVVFDIKDSDGTINVPFEHPLARKIKNYPITNLPKYVRYLHSLDLHVIARQALFRDDNIAQHHGALAVQSRSLHQPWRENGKLVWSDSSNKEVQDYNIALAKYVATSGVD